MTQSLRPPIILLGNFRSGTTMLQRVITTHPDTVALYEPVGLWLFADPGRRDDEFDEGDASERVKRYVRGRLLKFQRKNENRIIVEKTPHNIMRIPYVRAILPEAHYIYIIRDPLSFVSSVELKWQRPAGGNRILKRVKSTPVTQLHKYLARFISQQWNNRILGRKYLSVWGPRYRGIEQDVKAGDLLKVIARQWARASEKAERDLAAFGEHQVLRLRYEDFVENPVAGLKQICGHCGLEMTDDMAKTVKDMVKTDRKLKWQRFDAQDLARIIVELRAEMNRHGYDIPKRVNDAIAASEEVSGVRSTAQ